MPQNRTADQTRFVFPISEMESYPDGTTPLTENDAKQLAKIARCVLALCAFVPVGVAPEILLAGRNLIVNMTLSSSAPTSLVPADVHTLCTAALTALIRTAEKLKENAAQRAPLPISAIAPDKNVVKLLRELSADGVEICQPAIFESQGTKQHLPTLEPVDFTAANDEPTKSKTDTFRIVGLLRGDKTHLHQFIFAGGLRVDLPATPCWSWKNIHDVLDYETIVTGTVTRESISNRWTISGDSIIERHPPLL